MVRARVMAVVGLELRLLSWSRLGVRLWPGLRLGPGPG